MGAWETIRKEMPKGTNPGTLGEAMAISKAARVFVSVLPFLKDREAEEARFNADCDVREALMTDRSIQELGFL